MWYNYTSSNHTKQPRDVEASSRLLHQKGEFLMQNNSTRTPSFPPNLSDYAPWVAAYGLTASYGECQCGCGEYAGVCERADARHRQRRGEPRRFILGHNSLTNRPPIHMDNLDIPMDARCIQLTQGQVAIVDAADYEWLSQWKWYAYRHRKTWYARRHAPLENGRMVIMHRIIINAPDEILVDHRDGNGLNNRSDNLRLCTNQGNQRNQKAGRGSSIYKGVSWHNRRNKWQASIKCDFKHISLGYFTNDIDAAHAYDEKARELFGDFARLNFPT